ncbi:sugar kinase [Arthrobacter agilis]|uniref:sugar kinase n=1 Tax=Arthrobacter agilis TaxID=37921 RepID=UPI002365A22D|nr:sugar kinase [Arthrobacter agilis]WDF34048.1 sugar kinase [Arthrobacter agilis]
MTGLSLRPAAECRYDAVALGEVMLRFDPGAARIRTARSFDVWEGGGEYNVARGLARTFGKRTAVLSALVDNEIGHLVEGLILAGGVDTSWIRWCDFDGAGRAVRNALNFTERGFGIRGAVGVSDRGNSASSQLRPGDFDDQALLARAGARWLHTGGIFAGLSDDSAACAQHLMDAARAHGTVVSVDLNYRPSLFADDPDGGRARQVFDGLASRTDVLIGGFQDFEERLGVPGSDGGASDRERLEHYAGELFARYPSLRIVASTIRDVSSASIHTWSAHAVERAGSYVAAQRFTDLAILDRVGGGDGFVAGFVAQLLDGGSLQSAVDVGTAHGALAMTTPGDNSMASLQDVLGLVHAQGATERR